MKYTTCMKNALLSTICLLTLAACGGRESYTSSAPWKETDKHLSCDQLLLEMNDAKFWNSVANRNKKMGVMDVVWPVGYIGTRASADEAIGQTQDRLSHLNNIFKIKGCDRPYADMPITTPPAGRR